MRLARFLILLALSSIITFSSVASASTLTVACGSVSGPPDLSGNIQCPQFDLSGSLSAISIAVSGGLDGSLMLTNNANVAETFTATLSSDFNFGPLAGFSSDEFSASFTTGVKTLAGGATTTFTALPDSNTGSLGSNTTTFAPYTGAGDFSIPVFTITSLSIAGGGGNISASPAANANATAVVTYTYAPTDSAPVPEPASLTLLGLGLAGMGARRWKQRKA